MTAEPLLAGQLGDDPEQILRALPAFCQREFLTAYRVALDAAHQVDQFDRIRRVLHEWRLQAIAFADPAYETAVRAAREGRGQVTPAEQVPGFEHLQ